MQQRRERSMVRVSLDQLQQNSKRMLIADAATRDQLSQISCADSEERRFQINLPAAISERCSAKTLKDIRILQSHKMRLQTKARTRAPGPEISAADSAARSSAAAAQQLISILLLFTATVNAAISHPVLYSQPLEGEKKYISRENPPTHSFVTTVKWTTIHLFCKLTMQSKNVNTHVHSLSNSPKVFHMIPLILDHSSAFIIWHHTDGTIYHSNDLCR